MTPSRFQSELLPNESILWTGQPDLSKIFHINDLYLTPIFLYLFIFMSFNTITLFKTIFTKTLAIHLMVIIFIAGVSIFGILIFFYFAIGRFIFNAWQKKRTYYAVTNQRILILSKGIGNKVFQTFFINALPKIKTLTYKNSLGTIIFGDVITPQQGLSSLDRILNPYASAFFDILQVDSVYDLILSQRKT